MSGPKAPIPWLEGLPVAVTVTDEHGTIIEMNAKAREMFASYGGAELVGKSVFDCHPEPARAKTEELYRERQSNHYTVRRHGTYKIIHQVPWFQDGAFAGYVEFSLVVPVHLPHFERGE
jgi:transcriptional regulator with PAS, ATPase and Fis domain